MTSRAQSVNITELLRRRLSSKVFKVIRQIGNLAEEKGLPAYIVGGFVRDALLDVRNLDLDVVLEGNAISFVKFLQNKFKIDIVTHKRFGTAIVTFPDGFKIDIASARKEYYASAALLPIVSFSSIEEDLFRRDFTINALAVKINRHNFGQVLDLVSGHRDLKEGKIRILHEKSFIDDPTRIFRAIRFEQRYNFVIEKDTAKLIKQAKRLGVLKKLSRFRIGDEIIAILKEDAPLKILMRISKLCGLKIIHPLIKLDRRTSQQFQFARIFIANLKKTHFFASLDAWFVYFIILTDRLNLRERKGICRDFSLTKKDTLKLEFFKRNAFAALKKIDKETPLLPHEVYQILHPFSNEEVLVLLAQAKTRKGKERIKFFIHRLSQVKIKLTGNDLRKLGLKPGPKYRDILQKVLYEKIDAKLRSKMEELNYARYILHN